MPELKAMDIYFIEAKAIGMAQEDEASRFAVIRLEFIGASPVAFMPIVPFAT